MHFMSDEDSETGWDDDDTAANAVAVEEVAERVADIERTTVRNLELLAGQIGEIGQRVDAALVALQGPANRQPLETSNGIARPEPVAPVEDIQRPERVTQAAHSDAAPAAVTGDPGTPPGGAIADSAASPVEDAPPGPHAARAIAERAQSAQSADVVGGPSGGF
jgi:hypothetical protein